MKSVEFCQSCGMPLDGDDLRGTEKDGSLSDEYCKYCYQNGKLENPEMSFDEMRKNVIGQMEKENIPADIIETTVLRLAGLKRWKGYPSASTPLK